MLPVARAELHFVNRRGPVRLDHIDKGAGSAMLNRCDRHDVGVVQRVDEQLHIDELVGKEDLLFVVEYRPQLDGAGRRVDLVVDCPKIPLPSSVVPVRS